MGDRTLSIDRFPLETSQIQCISDVHVKPTDEVKELAKCQLQKVYCPDVQETVTVTIS